MDALLDCIDEIALDGLDGCPIQELWKHLEERRPPFPLKLDNGTKQFLWKAIVRIPDIEFFALTEPYSSTLGSNHGDGAKNESVHYETQNPLDQFPGPLRYGNEFKLISEEDTGRRGSCSSYHVRKNISDDVRDCVNLDTAYERWGDCLVMVASQELREKAVIGLECDPNISLTDIQYCLLEHVGQARYYGRMQKTIGSSFFKIESRTTFHHLKTLRKAHLVTMQPVVVSTTHPVKFVRNVTTNVVRLKRFHIQEHHKYDVLASRLCKLLLDSPSQEMALVDIRRHFSELSLSVKSLRRVRQFLQQAGYVVEEKIPGSCDTTDDRSYSPPNKKKKYMESAGVSTVKIRLLKPFVLKTDCIQQPGDDNEDEEDNDDDNDDEDHDDDDDDGGDREDPAWSDGYDSNVIAERSLIMQVYGIIHQAGPSGFTLTQCQKACKLPFADVRAVVKNLKRKNLIQEVHQDVLKQRVAWFVATPFVKSNVQAIKVKQVQDELKQMETKAVDLNSSKVMDDVPVENKKPKQSISGIVERVTYRKLKRKAVILEYLQKVKVVEGSQPIQKAVILSEEKEGQEGRIDRKVLNRMLDDLCVQGSIRQLKTVIHHGATSQMVYLFLHSSISNDDPEVALCLEQCRVRLRDQTFKVVEKEERAKQCLEEKERKKLEKVAAAEEKQKLKLEKKEKDAQKRAQQQQEKKEALLKKNEQNTTEKYQKKPSTRKYCYLPRFPRIQLIHELLWQLVYGQVSHKTSDVTEVSESKSSAEQELSDDCNDEVTRNLDDEWIKHLKPMPKLYDDARQPLHGWFRMGDVLLVMPLEILCKTMDITEEIDGLDEYALDPVKKYTLFCDLPQALRSRLKESRRYRPAPLDILCCLCQMGLVTPILPFPKTFSSGCSSTTIKLFLSKGVKLLDTTTSIPNYRTACPPQGKSFVSRCYMFTSMIAVQNFWSDLKCVCLNTPLGLVKIDEGTSDSDKVSFSNKNKRLINYAKEDVDEDKVDFPPGDQLGAAGLDRGLFSHLKKNWTRVMTSSALQLKRKLPTSTTIMAAEGIVKNTDSAVTQAGSPTTFWSIGRAEMKEQAKKEFIKQQKKRHKRKAADSQQNDEEPGGVKRTKTVDSAQEQQGNAQEKSNKEQHSCKTGHLSAIDEEDRNILARKAVERISFSAEEDSWLLLFRVALGVMKNETSRFYPFVCMRNILHKACVSSSDKTAPNIQRRILKLMKNPQSQMTVKICSAECVHDESFQGFDDPQAEFEETFQEVVKRLRQKFSSSSLSCDGSLTLVSSIKELRDKYKVQVLASQEETCSPDQEIVSLGPGINSVSDINKAAIRDQIQIAFTTPQESYDAYRVFQMFNSYTREELEDVFKEMQKKNLVTRRKMIEHPDSQFTRALPFASMTYQLSSGYHRLFMHGFKLVTFYRDCAHFWKQLVSGEQHTLNYDDTSKSKTEQATKTFTPGTIEFRPPQTLGGHVACVLSLLTTNKVSVEVNIPDEVLNIDSSELSENTEQQTSLQTSDDYGCTQPTKPTSTEKNKEKSASGIASKTTRATEKRQITNRKVSDKSTERSKLSSPVAVAPKKISIAGESPSSSEGVLDNHEAKGAKEKRLEKCDIFTLSLSSSSTITKFKSPYDLKSQKECSKSLTSHTEVSELQHTKEKVSKVSTVPVAALSYSTTSSRSSRTALMLARGGKDPYSSINQLPARAFNTHDFMTLYPCKIVLKLKDRDSTLANVAGDKNMGQKEMTCTEGESSPDASLNDYSSTTKTASTSFDKEFDNSSTSPVVVSMDVSMQDYVEQSRIDFGFNETDFPLARIIHSIVEERKEFGITVALLQGRIDESHQHELSLSQYSFEQHLMLMCKAKLLYRVGSYQHCVVTARYVKPWCVTLLKAKDDSQKTSKPVKDVSMAGDSSPVVSDSSKQPGFGEKDQNALEVTGIYSENSSSRQTNQTGSTNAAQVINQCTSSDVDTSPCEYITGTTSQTSSSSDATDDSSSKEVKSLESGRKKHKVRNYEQYTVICRPWITINGNTSQQLLRVFREMVLMLILSNPGISQFQVTKHFFEALRPVALQDILDSLILEGCIVKHVRKVPVKVSLFSTCKPQEPSEAMTFFTPTVDCIMKLATSRLTGYM